MFKFLISPFFDRLSYIQNRRFFFLELFLGRTYKAAQERQFQQNNKGRRTKDGIHIDHIPSQKGKRTGGNFKGGEYVDYEEL